MINILAALCTLEFHAPSSQHLGATPIQDAPSPPGPLSQIQASYGPETLEHSVL